jgi:hypothetical protein
MHTNERKSLVKKLEFSTVMYVCIETFVNNCTEDQNVDAITQICKATEHRPIVH